MFGFGILGALGKGNAPETVVHSTTTTLPPPPPQTDAPCPATDGSSPRRISFPREPPMCIDPALTYRARFATTAGVFEAVLDAHRSPRAVNNFVFLALYHFYDGLPFHRVGQNYFAQSGDPLGDAVTGPGYYFDDDPLPRAGDYKLGSLLMAHEQPNRNGSQFLIVLGPRGMKLQPVFPILGQVTSGAEALRKINAGGTSDVNLPPRVMYQITSLDINPH
jgi:cyclophilin family peptidyl-prolyl cis-trans isomerase